MKEVEKKEYLDLAFAFATQEDVAGQSDWLIKKNKTFEGLGSFNGKISEEDIWAILKFSQKYELEAFNTGIQFQKELSNKAMTEMQSKHSHQVKLMREENERLAIKLMQLIGDPDDVNQ